MAGCLLALTATGADAEDEMRKNDEAVHAFDWLFGRWTVENRYLEGRLQDSSEWATFHADYEAWPILRGMGNQDRFTTDFFGESFEGMSIRYYDPVAGLWSIHWLDTLALTQGRPELADAMVGTIENGRGEFFGSTTVEGQPVRVRFRWESQGPEKARWEQAFSADEGRTWEENWIMEFTRVASSDD